ncbi:MAG: iron-binding protein [Acidimicrobiia bacterium]
MEGEARDSVPEVKIHVRRNGPYFVEGRVGLLDSDGNEFTTEDKTWLCRCGHSENKPFCDGSHKKIGFQSEVKAVAESDS